MRLIDQTHSAMRRSWIGSADGHPCFPIQNLPFGIFSTPDGRRRTGVAIGDMILDVAAVLSEGLLQGEAAIAAEAAAQDALNDFFALAPSLRRALRGRLSELLTDGSPMAGRMQSMLHRAADCAMHLPARIGDYTDFYVGIHHATHVGQLFRPDNPLLPNYKHIPIGYHGRASTIVPSGTAVRRPSGQWKAPNEAAPVLAPSQRLDFELELGVWIGPGNDPGEPVPIGDALEHVAGFCLLNDWSARDIQAWEYQPLGPFLSKSFATSISPWVVMLEALAPFRGPQPPRPQGDPDPLPYLRDAADQADGALDVQLEVWLLTPGLKEKGLPPHRLTLSGTSHMYWTVAQMVAHHTSNGCNLRPGDLFGSGTLSGPDRTGCGSLLELSDGGKSPLRLASGEERIFIEDGDEVILRAQAKRDGCVPIGFGDCTGLILPAR